MFTNLSLDQSIKKAKLYLKKGEFHKAEKIYQDILNVYPKNLRARQGLIALEKSKKIDNLENPPVEVIKQLLNSHNNGEYLTVTDKAQTLAQQYPNTLLIWSILSISSARIGNLNLALEACKKSILLEPNDAGLYSNMGNILKEQGKQKEALEAYKKAISIKPSFVEAYNNIGVTLHNQGNLIKAIEIYKKALTLKPDYTEVYNNLGEVLKDQGKMIEAEDAYKKATSLKPDYVEAYNNLGIVLKKQNKIDLAIEAYTRAISINSSYVVSYYNLGNLYLEQGKIEKAIKLYREAISLKPDYSEAYCNIGVALKDLGQVDEAIVSFKKSISLKPKNPEAYRNLGVAFQYQGKLDEAIKAHKKSISLNPNDFETHQNLGFTLLNEGKLKEGFDELEWRWKTTKNKDKQRHFVQPMWDGNQNLNGKRILLWCEQGVGDTIMWASRLSLVASRAAHCILECQPKLVPLLKRSFPNVEVKAEDRRSDQQRDDFDYHLPMGSLYKNFIKKLNDNDKADAYLVPDTARVDYWKERLKSLGDGPYIGISWKSADMSPIRLPNYASISKLSSILKLPNVTYVNLQYNDFVNDITKIKEELGVTIHNFDDLDHFNNLDDVAALCSALDIVVSTKTTVPLISSAVGTLTKLANWKQSWWNNILLNPSGPSIDIYERNTWELWDNVFTQIAKDIRQLTKDWSPK